MKHHEAGVKTTIYIATNIVGGFEARNTYAKQAITFAKEHGIPYAELDYRVTKKKDSKIITGMDWAEGRRLVRGTGGPERLPDSSRAACPFC